MSRSNVAASTFKKWVLRQKPVPDIGPVCSGMHAVIKKHLHVKQRTVIHEDHFHRIEADSHRLRCGIFELRGTHSQKKSETSTLGADPSP